MGSRVSRIDVHKLSLQKQQTNSAIMLYFQTLKEASSHLDLTLPYAADSFFTAEKALSPLITPFPSGFTSPPGSASTFKVYLKFLCVVFQQKVLEF